MPAEGKVSLAWQIVMVIIIPFAGIWAFYRIKKLQKAFLYLVLPEILLTVLIFAVVFSMMPDQEALEELGTLEETAEDVEPVSIAVAMGSTIAGFGIVGLSIYLIIRWTEQWNKKFELNEK